MRPAGASPSFLSRAVSSMPPFRGKTRVVDTLGRLARRLGKSRTTFAVAPGVRMEVDLDDRIQRQMWGNCYEPHVRRCLELLLHAGDTFLDVGAHVGYFSVSAAAIVRTGGRVLALEPDPDLHQQLARNLAPFSFAQAVPLAAWETEGTLRFERSFRENESGWGVLTAVRDWGKGAQVEVETISLDACMDRFQLGAVHAVKMDAEGAEFAILQGARKMIARFRPFLVLELNDVLLRQAGHSASEVAACLLGLGYRSYRLEQWRLDPCAPENAAGFAEVLCLPEERVDACLAILRGDGR